MGKNKEPVAIIDLDFLKYAVASVGDRRFVEVTHTPSGRVKEYDNKTTFWGRNTQGGALKEINNARLEKGLPPFPPEDFEIIQKQERKEPLANILHSAKLTVDGVIKASGAKGYEAYIGKGESFRVELSTLMKYKGQRVDTPPPTMLEEVSEYLTKKYSAEVITGIEVDEKIVMRYLELEKEGVDCFVVAVDKDAYTCPIKLYNPNRPEEGVVDCRGFGKLWVEESGKAKKVRGYGRLFKYWMISSQDTCDNYKANAHSDVRWGELSAYKALKDCENDKQAWEALVDIFKNLYPEPKVITTWKGDDIEIDWLYCLQELTNMAHIWRWENDLLDVRQILDKLGVSYE